ncbi:Pirin-like isoform X2 [Oopsacas minuta]|uniref:Pirin-like isoform X2 n=1 Tax=Oopsacas minuta TaxID=111878 RepID=A0AAV7JV47_9METZ|nr:Pirin-like isoform X2 [Oopsacas minuta]
MFSYFLALGIISTIQMADALQSRSIEKSFESIEQQEGINARVRRSIGRQDCGRLDPFLMLDEMMGLGGNSGFPDHPHRGFETVTYVLKGCLTHEDFKGNKGVLNEGDLQWMTAGKGILHSEMPCGDGQARGLQLWVNLPAKYKMCDPRYQELKSKDIPKVEKDGVMVAVIAGKAMGIESKVYTTTPIYYLDFKLQPGASHFQEIGKTWNAFIYILDGKGLFGNVGGSKECSAHYTLLFNQKGDGIRFENNGSEVLHFVLVAGQPIGESVAQAGPFVMNTNDELRQAMLDFRMCTNGFEDANGWKSENGKALIAKLAK